MELRTGVEEEIGAEVKPQHALELSGSPGLEILMNLSFMLLKTNDVMMTVWRVSPSSIAGGTVWGAESVEQEILVAR